MVKHKIHPAQSAEQKRRGAKCEEVLRPGLAGGVAPGLWSDAAAELEAMEFTNLEEAFTALIERVLCKLEGAAAPDEELKSFLFELLDSDPELKDDLRKIFKLRE